MPSSDLLNDEHRDIAKITESIPGILMPGDHEALYKTAYEHGDVILEIGAFAGKSAVIELLGAKANTARQQPPVYIGIDMDALAVFRTWNSLRRFGLQQNAAVFLGDLASFVASEPITPSMVFLDGDHLYGPVRKDLECLEQIVAPNTPVLCHDYVLDPSLELEAKPAIDDFVKEGRATFVQELGARCALILVHGKAKQSAHRPDNFAELREKWLFDASASLAESWTSINEENKRLRASRTQRDEKSQATIAKLQSRTQRLKSEVAAFKPLLGRWLYRRGKSSAAGDDA